MRLWDRRIEIRTRKEKEKRETNIKKVKLERETIGSRPATGTVTLAGLSLSLTSSVSFLLGGAFLFKYRLKGKYTLVKN